MSGRVQPEDSTNRWPKIGAHVKLASQMVAITRQISVDGDSLLGDGELVLELKPSAIAPLSLELTLLSQGLVEQVKVSPRTGPTIVLRLAADVAAPRAAIECDSEGYYRVRLGRDQLGYMHVVLLRAFRDHAAEVSHVHIEGRLGGRPFDFTLLFSVFMEPMTSDEAAKLLDGS